MLAVTRHRLPAAEADGFAAVARTALTELARRPGFRRAQVARALEDPRLWVVTQEWDDVGSYRRALSARDVRVASMPMYVSAVAEPTAYELAFTLDGPTGGTRTWKQPRRTSLGGPPTASRME